MGIFKPREEMVDDKALSVLRIARLLAISGRTARRIIEAGDLRAHRIGRQWRVFEPDLKEYLARHVNSNVSPRRSAGGQAV
jgi:excisionase family DNA binding protein